MTNTTQGALCIAPLQELPTTTAPSCQLERVALLLTKGDDEKYIEIWAQPDNLAAVIKAKRAISPGWGIVETMTGQQLPKFVDVAGDAWFEF